MANLWPGAHILENACAHPSVVGGTEENLGRVALSAARALYYELMTFPKPGLVSPIDNGSHTDMNAATFMRSLFSLRHSFRKMAFAGYRLAPFSELKQLGIAAEQRMLRATGGINTHRGAIFTLGLLAAAAGWLIRTQQPVNGRHLCQLVQEQWGQDILASGDQAPASHGSIARQRYAAGGAREMAAAGFPLLRETALPVLRKAIDQGVPIRVAAVQTLFSLMAELIDSNLLYRAGRRGLAFAQGASRHFLTAGGIAQPDWPCQAMEIHRLFVARRLSPGGAADLLAAALFIQMLEQPPEAGWAW